MIYQKWYISMLGSELRKIPVLFEASLIPLMIPTPAAFPTSTSNPAYSATAPLAQVSPDTHMTSTAQLSSDTKQGIIDSYSSDFQNAAYNGLNATSQTILIVNAYGSPTTQTHLVVFDKAFNAHEPPSYKVPYSIGCSTIKPNATGLDISFDSENKASILVYCSALNNSAYPVVTGTSATVTQCVAMIALANQYNTGQGHSPLHIDSALRILPERTNYNNDLEITLGNNGQVSTVLQSNAATRFNVFSTWRTPSIQSLAPVPLNITYPQLPALFSFSPFISLVPRLFIFGFRTLSGLCVSRPEEYC